ncbi:Cyclin-dependent kinase inhibitor [Quillaja saponaria]|uniref:Cyclin-dependent kinase inhibitor n=1 Tax=Quillaja saponaria TaxID=32244 RepID=A0AAD7VLY4_QUISA|nr:Cyclin-dependent kinase inhibitor [Quillaja saponaria]
MGDEDGCSTPKRGEFQIPTALVPPPPPRKKPFSFGEKRVPVPKKGFFQPPDLDLFFSVGPTQRQEQACV